MSQTDTSSKNQHPFPLLPPVMDSALEYAIDAWQRSVLTADVMRQRGNQYQRHVAKQAPNVLSMKAEVILDGRTLERPVNYILTRITPPKNSPIDPIKRPFVVVDPRAGHGPGIAGFKPESEIGVAIEAGHPCYFIGFLPRPEPEQGVEDVVCAEARFLEEVIALHPEAEGKPVVIGNCQAGWQLMMAAATRPELFGPIIIAGAPLSYWAGWRGKNPMRYSGGLAGGSWMTMMTSDLGGGLFDGANLVQNFENLNPANTYWSKQFNLYANVDTEASRYLGFERWWGGHVFLNGKEIQYIVDNLFVGNKLSTARMVTQDGLRLDLRNIRSPIIVFCSKGDNITPPPQALGWITDLYQTDKEVLAHGQTIIYAVHESIGHLGIFVSGAIAKKEHREFTCNIDMIDVLPAGIYEAVIHDKTPDTPNADLAYGDYVLTFERRHLADVEKIVQHREDDDRRFAAVSRLSQVNVGLYKSFIQPWVKIIATPGNSEKMQQWHPLRLPYESISDKNPLVASLAPVAVQVKNHRQKAAVDNPFLQLENQFSKSIESALELYGEWRDNVMEQMFMTVYGAPLVQDVAGLGAKEGAPREHPGVSPEHINFVKRRVTELRKLVDCGGTREASIRVMMYIAQAQGGIDERSFNLIRQLRAQEDHTMTLPAFKRMVREQAMVMVVDPEGSVNAIPALLSHHSATEIEAAAEFVTRVAMASGALNQSGKERLKQVCQFYEEAARLARTTSGDSTDMQTVNVVRDTEQSAPKAKAKATETKTESPVIKEATSEPVAPKSVAPKKVAPKPVAKRAVAKKAAPKSKPVVTPTAITEPTTGTVVVESVAPIEAKPVDKPEPTVANTTATASATKTATKTTTKRASKRATKTVANK